ncbi:MULTISPECIES: hypothetical protein [Bradyrhizobium]|uniref:HipA domain-containing protein n=2 Tax=Bradyrhizobium TaxID=374 RepID=A0A9X1R5Z3_9BRAD|nr:MULTISPECIES: hypothetical protein [Bradyrhizobium]MCG2628147.1 HipA domain-containing protein [Bradyrhizobium zhengyangense]MCG2643266.1 HipA domain-containing protein [Bradyrhizobium zhengyangense]MCG2670420.1 HipA domain-containing protein [Bradyrhizobium zhengyangense]MDN4985845.1 hypothetical protein [Bradyrhizobium sp. WYCCWR 13022]MDN5002776.1 hypothetical protein [Bradyrhizobium sp. WYCCWR 12677]
MISGLTGLRADEAVEMRDRWSYVLMAEEMRRVTEEPGKDAKELFRRMTFNALISNVDDQPAACITTDATDFVQGVQ